MNLLILISVTLILVLFTTLETLPYTTALSNLTTIYCNVSKDSSTQMIGYPAVSQVGVISAGVVAGFLLTVLAVLMLGVVQSWVNQPNHRVKKFTGKFWDQCLVGIGVLISGNSLAIFTELSDNSLKSGRGTYIYNRCISSC